MHIDNFKVLLNSKLLNDINFSYAYGEALKYISDANWLDEFFEDTKEEA